MTGWLFADTASTWRWLLGLRDIDPTDPRVHLSWQYPLPAWAWAGLIVLAAGLSAYSYRKMLGARAGRTAMTVLRTMVLLVIAGLLLQPVLVLPQEKVEEDRVIFLVDRSASMRFADQGANALNPAQKLTRDDQLRSILSANQTVWNVLGEQHGLQWSGFAENLRELSGPLALGEADGSLTALRSALEQSLRQSGGRSVNAIVLFSDGRSSEPVEPRTLALLQQLQVPVFTVALGASDAAADLFLQQVEWPERAFVKDVVPVSVTVGRSGSGPDAPLPAGTRLRLVDTVTGEVLDEKPADRVGAQQRLQTSPRVAGPATWRVELISPGGDLVEENNFQKFDLVLVDRPIRLLYVENVPRWEYRYLKNTFIREKSVTSSIQLVSADRSFAQEGTLPLRRLPQTEEELKPYDLFVIGDVPSAFFSADQLELFRRHVAQEGAGLLWIGGPAFTPASYVDTALGPMLPMTGPPQPPLLEAPIRMQPTPIAQSLGVLQLRDLKDPDRLWPASLPDLKWGQALLGLRPAAEALAVDANSNLPLVVRMRYGAGMVVYVATDEIWRWRYGRGELWPEQFWMQIIRLLARGRLQTDDPAASRARLQISSRRAAAGDTLVVEVVLSDQTLLQKPPEEVEVEVVSRDSTSAAGRQVIRLQPADRPGHYRAAWTPHLAGDWVLKVRNGELADLQLSQTLQVERADEENRDPATDHALLKDLSEKTGGRVVAADQIDQLPRWIRPPNVTVADLAEPLWHSPLALILLVLLLGAEWIGRRVMGLA